MYTQYRIQLKIILPIWSCRGIRPPPSPHQPYLVSPVYWMCSGWCMQDCNSAYYSMSRVNKINLFCISMKVFAWFWMYISCIWKYNLLNFRKWLVFKTSLQHKSANIHRQLIKDCQCYLALLRDVSHCTRRQSLYKTQILYTSHGYRTSVTVWDFSHCTRLWTLYPWPILSYTGCSLNIVFFP